MKKDILVNGIVIGQYETTGDTKKDYEAALKIIKEKGLDREVTTNDSMFGLANSFAKVAQNIYDDAFKKSPFKGNFMGAFVVNGVFSIELYLKTIHNAYGNNVRGHHLSNIYKGMPKLGKAIFIKAAVDAKPLYNLPEGDDIHSCLEKLSSSFEEWRYLYEKDYLNAEIQSIRYTMHTCHEACVRVRENVIN